MVHLLVCTTRAACCGDTAMDVSDPKHTIAGARLMRLANPLPVRGNGFASLGVRGLGFGVGGLGFRFSVFGFGFKV